MAHRARELPRASLRAPVFVKPPEDAVPYWWAWATACRLASEGRASVRVEERDGGRRVVVTASPRRPAG